MSAAATPEACLPIYQEMTLPLLAGGLRGPYRYIWLIFVGASPADTRHVALDSRLNQTGLSRNVVGIFRIPLRSTCFPLPLARGL